MIFPTITFKMFPLLDRNLPHVEEKILSYLEPKDLAAAMVVSKQWYQRAKPFLCEWYGYIQRKNGYVPLQTAIVHGYDHLVAFYLQKKQTNVNEISKNTNMNALALHQRHWIDYLLLPKEEIDLNTRPLFNMYFEDKLWHHRCTALQMAARYGRAGFVKMLVERMDTDVNARDPFGRTALIVAVLNGKVGAMDELLKHPMIDVNIEDNDGFTALSVAKTILELGTHNEKSQNIIDILEKKNAK